MLITIVSVVFITLALVLFSVGNFKGARVLVPIVVVAMGMVLIKGSYDIGVNQVEAKQAEESDKTEDSSSDVKDKYLKELDALSEKGNLNRFGMMKLWATLIYIGVAF